jgi:hypothetical protein
MKKETKKSVVEQAAVALRLWSDAWRQFDKTGKNKPETFEEVIKPFVEMEKDQREKDFINGYKACAKMGGQDPIFDEMRVSIAKELFKIS